MDKKENTNAPSGRSSRTIDRSSSITLGLSIMLCGVIAAGVKWKVDIEHQIADGRRERQANADVLTDYKENIAHLEEGARELVHLQRAVLELQGARIVGNQFAGWHRYSQDQWASQLGQRNPALDVPDPLKTPWFDRQNGAIVRP